MGFIEYRGREKAERLALKYPHPSSLYFQSPFRKEAYCLRVRHAFLFKYTGSEGVGGVVFEYGNCPLDDDGAFIILVVGKMHCASRDLCPIVYNGLVYLVSVIVVAAKSRDKAGVDVHYHSVVFFRDFI